MRIALDVDGVLADVMLAWLDRSGTAATKDEITDWEFWRRLGMEKEQFHAELDSCWGDWGSVPPTEQGLAQTTGELRRLGRVDIVTARDPSTDGFVREWLASHGISYCGYVSVEHGPMKAGLGYDILIDDSPHNAEAMARRGGQVILYGQPWNGAVSGPRIHRIARLSESPGLVRSLGGGGPPDVDLVPAPDVARVGGP